MNILISAFAFSPYRGSECAVGWNIVTRLARYHDVTVLCGDLKSSMPTRHELENYFSQESPIAHLKIHYVKPSLAIQLVEKLHTLPGLWMIYYLAYNMWQKRAYRQAVKLHEDTPYDLVHHLNMIGYREPGYLWKLPIPFVWGPIGGAANEPLSYRAYFSIGGYLRIIGRKYANNIQMRFSNRARHAAFKAVKIWAVTMRDVQMVNQRWKLPAEQMLETGTLPRFQTQARSWSGSDSLKIVWSGIHVSRKALPILLHAIADQRLASKVSVDILGDGPDMAAWKSLACSIGVAKMITWHGQLSHSDAMAIMNDGHILVFSSIREGTPHVVLEALSLGLPVICHDACGMGLAINESCGIIVPMQTPEGSVIGFRDAIFNLLSNPERIRELSSGALARSSELSWDRLSERISSAYSTLKLASGLKDQSHSMQNSLSINYEYK